LKTAQSASDGIAAGNLETLRVAPLAAPAAPLTTRVGGAGYSAPQPSLTVQARQFAEQSRFVNGRSFYQNGNQWIDSETQKLANARRVRVQFDSPGYFNLIKTEPKAAAWLALGRNVQFVLSGTIYEVFE